MDLYKSSSPTSTFPGSKSALSHSNETRSFPKLGKNCQFAEQVSTERCDTKDSQNGDMAEQIRPDFEEAQLAVQRAVQTRIAAQLQSTSNCRTEHAFCPEQANTDTYRNHCSADSEAFPHISTNDIQSPLHSEPSSKKQSAEYNESQECLGSKEVQRKKIKIQLIRDPRSRQVTFLKRKNGLMKKAMELSVLCNCEVAVIVYNNNNGKMFEYSSHNMEQTMYRYATYNGPFERRRTERFYDLSGSKSNANIPLNEPHLAQAALDAAGAAAERPRPSHNFDSTTSGGEVRLGKKRATQSSSASPSRRARITSQVNFAQDVLTGPCSVLGYTSENQAMFENRPYSSKPPPSPLSSSVQLPIPDFPARSNANTMSRFTPAIAFPSSSVTPRTADRQISAFLGLRPSTTGTENNWQRPIDSVAHQQDCTRSKVLSSSLPPPWPTRHSDALPPTSDVATRSNMSNERTHYDVRISSTPQTAQSQYAHHEDQNFSDHITGAKFSPEHDDSSRNLDSVNGRVALPPPIQNECIENSNTHSSGTSLPTPSALTSFLNMDLFTPRTSDAPAPSNAQYILPSPSNSAMFPMTPHGMSFEALLSTPSMRNAAP